MLKLFIEKPVLAGVLGIFIFCFGLATYFLLPVRDYPILPPTQVTITTDYPGASPQVMEGFISTPILQALSGLDGVDYITSQNKVGESFITINFHLGFNVDGILSQVSNRVNAIKWQFPKEINGPQIAKVNPNQGPTAGIEYIGVSDSKLSQEQVTSYLVRNIQPILEALPGVSSAIIWGGKTYAMRVWLDPTLMAAFHITASDVKQALLNNNLRSTAGNLKGKSLIYNVTVNSNLSTEKEFNNIVIKKVGNRYIRIKDIGQAQLGAITQKIVGTVEGHKVAVIEIVPEERADSIDVANAVNKELITLKKNSLPGMEYTVLLDKTLFSKASIHEVHVTLVEACIIVFIIIFLFLGSWRLLSVPIVTIPLSLLGGIGIMWLLGYSLNGLTFLAFVLAIGLVVDDAIVVIENVHRHIIKGETPLVAAKRGIGEMYTSVISMTLTVAIVLAPIGFVPGYSGALFKQFAFSLAFVVLVSGVCALFLSPAMSAKVLKQHSSGNTFSHKTDHVFEIIKNWYKLILTQVIEWRVWLAVLFVVIMLFGLLVSSNIQSELLPSEDTGILNAIGLTTPGTNFDYSQKQGAYINQLFKKNPYMARYGVFFGFPDNINSVIGFIGLKPKYMEKEDAILPKMNAQLQRIPTMMAFALKMPTAPGDLDLQPVNFVLKTSESYRVLNAAAQKLLAAAVRSPILSNVQVNLKMNQINVNVKVNREKANALGIPMSQISDALTTMLGEPILSYFGLQNRSYEVIPQVFRRFRMNPDDISHYYVKSVSGKMVPLSDVVNVTLSMSPNSLNQFQMMHSTMLVASVAPGHTLGEALTYLKTYASNHLPNTISYDYAGQSRQYIQTEGKLMDVFIIGVLLIYLLLTINFSSFRDPLIIMTCVPLSLVGAVFAIYMFGATFNIYTKIGLIMLIGLISKHGILIVNFANILQTQGYSRLDAAIEGAAIRLRPILMTTLAMIGGAIPLVMADGAGHTSRQQIGWVIIGGMILGSCLSLFVVPAVYAMYAKTPTTEEIERAGIGVC